MAAGCSGANPANSIASQFIRACPAAYYSQVRWSGDGKHIAFLSSIPPVRTQIYVMSPDGRDITRLTNQGGDYDLYGWSPDGRLVAFGLGGGLFVKGLDGFAKRIPIQGAFVTAASWSPDSHHLVFSEISYEGGYFIDLYVADIEGGEPARLTFDKEADRNPDWSPDGSRIAYVRTEATETQVMIINADGSQPHRVTHGPTSHIDPQWSPDGTQLAYVAADTHTRLMVAAEGKDTRQLWQISSGEPFKWLPDSRHLSYFSPQASNNLVVGDSVSLEEDNLTPAGKALVGSFSWSVDGAEAVVVTNNPLEIVVLDHSKSVVRQLTDNPAKYSCFYWPF